MGVGVAEEVPYRATEAARWAPAFTRRREHFVGRMAMLGVAAMWMGEVSAHCGGQVLVGGPASAVLGFVRVVDNLG